METLWVGVGGALGSVARYHVDGWVQQRLGPAFPYGTLAVNLLGSFLLTFVMYLGLRAEVLSPTARIAISTGVLGGFTTYSTFNYETLRYLQDGAWGLGALNIMATVAACLAAGGLGWMAGKVVAGA